jgi:hypothetical protein
VGNLGGGRLAQVELLPCTLALAKSWEGDGGREDLTGSPLASLQARRTQVGACLLN